ncbi:hypothetical protein KIN20_020095 [Parelaphostrongylus tenuis]|uniref:L antigen family member 3 n=1 Tax=Parelaphostrongylus tenuis TaxID=148309 RepID=A0AAD5N9F5_PARTN|nr:hypothetical protein KIN20_020095 [Parelaphostrongylus tenuis]
MRHSAAIKLDLESEDTAEKVCRVLRVDKEPSRSTAVREFYVDGCHLHIELTSSDTKSLRKSLLNTLEMCDLAKATVDLARSRKWIDVKELEAKKPKMNCAE